MKRLDLKPFHPINFDRIPSHTKGIYIIWLDCICVYIGMVRGQKIGQRLYQHYKKPSNELLKSYHKAYGKKLKFCWKKSKNPLKWERVLIQKLNPKCNLTYLN